MTWLFCLLAAAQEAPAVPETPVVEPPVVEAPTGPDRSVRPTVTEPSPLELDDFTIHTLSNGLVVRFIRVPRLRDVSVKLDIWKGSVDLAQFDPDVVSTLSSLWGGATEKYDSESLSMLEDEYDMAVYASISPHSARVTLNVPAEDLDIGLELMEEVAFRPVFAKRDLKLAKEEYERFFTVQAPSSPSTIVSSAVAYATYPAEHPYGLRPDLARRLSVKTKELVAVHEAVMALGPATLTVVGDLEYERIGPSLERMFSTLKADGERSPELPVELLDKGVRVLAIDLPKSEQGMIRLVSPAPTQLAADQIAYSANVWALGGHFLSRLNKNLREDKGWTYGVRAGSNPNDTYGLFSVSVDVPVDKVADAIVELNHEIESVATEGVTDEERTAWWRGVVKYYNDTRGTIDHAEGFYNELVRRELTLAEHKAELLQVQAVDGPSSLAAAERWFASDAPRLWVVGGPRPQLEAAFTTLGLQDVEWVSVSDALYGRMKGGRQ